MNMINNKWGPRGSATQPGDRFPACHNEYNEYNKYDECNKYNKYYKYDE